MGKKLESSIKGAKLKIIKDAKHNLPLTKPEIVSEIIYNYLNELT
jgi:pimeloyl-ACP methyl ester carboxylesterase